MNFDRAFDILIGHEGGYSNHPSDPGGETMWGVTRRVALQEGYSGQMRLLPRETAKAIYRRKYWDAINADAIAPEVRYAVFDAAVNSGPARALDWLSDASGEPSDLAVAVRFTAIRLDFLTSLPTWGQFGRGWARRIAAVLQTSLETAP